MGSILSSVWAEISELKTTAKVRYEDPMRVLKYFHWGSVVFFVLVIGAIAYHKDSSFFISEQVQTNVNFQVYGAVVNQFRADDFEDFVTKKQIEIYNQTWDQSSYVLDTDNDEIFIATNLIVQPEQRMGTCPDHESKVGFCSPEKEDECLNKKYNPASRFFSGDYTGKCVETAFSNKTTGHLCEIQTWCPTLRRNEYPLRNNRAVLGEVYNSTTLIMSNSVNFPKLGEFWARHLEEFEKCEDNDIHCPVYSLQHIINEAKPSKSVTEILKYGAVIAVNVHWDCVIGSDPPCEPVYTFQEIPNPNPSNTTFRYFEKEHANGLRTLYKAFGIRLKVIITGTAREWRFWNWVWEVLRMTGLCTILADISLWAILMYFKPKPKTQDDSLPNKESLPLLPV